MRKKTSRKKYTMPKSKRLFKLDVEIGRHLLGMPDALSEAEITIFFKASKRTFSTRARKLASLLKRFEKQQIVKLLYEMGRERAVRKK